MKKLLISLSLLMFGFMLYPVTQELADYVYLVQFEKCFHKMGPLTEKSPLSARFKCVHDESPYVRILEYVLWRPNIAEHKFHAGY